MPRPPSAARENVGAAEPTVGVEPTRGPEASVNRHDAEDGGKDESDDEEHEAGGGRRGRAGGRRSSGRPAPRPIAQWIRRTNTSSAIATKSSVR